MKKKKNKYSKAGNRKNFKLCEINILRKKIFTSEKKMLLKGTFIKQVKKFQNLKQMLKISNSIKELEHKEQQQQR